MNAGAYGGEFGQVARSVRCLTPEGRAVEVTAKEAAWSYRHSMMDDRGYLVLSRSWSLSPTTRRPSGRAWRTWRAVAPKSSPLSQHAI